MAIQKKSLIGNLSATKKAIVATNVASTAPVSGSKLETAKRGHELFSAKEHKLFSAKEHKLFSAKEHKLFSAKEGGAKLFSAKEGGVKLFSAKKR